MAHNDQGNDDIRQTLEEAARDLKELARAQAELFEARARLAVEEGGDVVKRHPLMALLAAFSLGWLVAKIFGRRSR